MSAARAGSTSIGAACSTRGLAAETLVRAICRGFDTVEINASFYRLPLASTFDAWREKAPAGFRYAVKVNRFITHMKKLLDCSAEVERFSELARRLGETLGPLLYQMPPSLHKDVERLDAFLSGLPADLEQVVEFRHNSWYEEDVLALLDRHGIGFVAHDLKGLVSPRWASGRTAYVRFPAQAANIGAVTPTTRSPSGPTGLSTRSGGDEASGAISTTISKVTQSRMREY